MNNKPNPGSDEAIQQGCICPVYDNAKGRGWMGSGLFWYNEHCPLHKASDEKAEEINPN